MKNKKKAVIFDMDGVISDTQVIHSLAWSKVLAGYGIEISPEEITRRYAGSKSREVFGNLLSQYGLIEFLDKALSEKDRLLSMGEKGKKLKAVKGAKILIKKLYKDGRDLAVASGSMRANVEYVLKELDVLSYFQVIVGGDEVENGKPAPDGFLLAAKRMNRKPEECIVIEDSRNGMLAANLAGMKCLGLVPEINPIEYTADKLVLNLGDLDWEDFS